MMAPICGDAQTVISLDDVARSVLLGQVYPSGNAYLLQFRENEDDTLVWPKTVVMHPLRSHSRPEGTLSGRAYGFVTVLSSGSSPQFPFLERQRHPGLEYLDGLDFFATASDMSSLEDVDIGQYRGSPLAGYFFPVVAVTDAIVADDIVYAPAGLKRPLTREEEREVAQSRKRAAKESTHLDCTTVPAFLDDAVQLVGFTVKGTPYHVRISQYTNPGCGGHVSDIYVLDVLQDHAVKGRYELYHYWGVL